MRKELALLLALAGCENPSYDVNKDGLPDDVRIVDQVVFLRLGGTEEWRMLDFVTPLSGDPRFGDRDGDGHIDIMYRSCRAGIFPVCSTRILYGRGDGTFYRR